MNAESLNLSTSLGATTAYVARPHEEFQAAILLIQEYWGINQHIRDIAGRYANEGYLCVAPDLYRGRLAKDTAEASALKMRHSLAHLAGSSYRKRLTIGAISDRTSSSFHLSITNTLR